MVSAGVEGVVVILNVGEMGGEVNTVTLYKAGGKEIAGGHTDVVVRREDLCTLWWDGEGCESLVCCCYISGGG